MNLTAITEPEGRLAVKHIIDSLLAYDEKIFPGKLLADVGAGAGFPGIPTQNLLAGIKGSAFGLFG